MRWLLAGLTFAALVALAVGTAVVRAENAIQRHRCALRLAEVRDRIVEKGRLEGDLLGCESARRLAGRHWQLLEAEFDRRRGRM